MASKIALKILIIFLLTIGVLISSCSIAGNKEKVSDSILEDNNHAPQMEISVLTSDEAGQSVVADGASFDSTTGYFIHPEVREELKEEKVLRVVVKSKDKSKVNKYKKKDISDEYTEIEATSEDIEELSGEGVEVYPNRKYSMLLSESVPAMNAQSYWNKGYTGSGVRIAILDTGIDSDHPMLEGKVILAEDFSGSGNPEDVNGHGTHVAGIAAGSNSSGGYNGVAPGALLINGKVLDDNGDGTTSSIAAGIYWAMDPDDNPSTDDGADVISMSLGAPYSTPDPVIDSAINEAVSRGVTVVIASGNCGPGSTQCGSYTGVTVPGNNINAITVGATDDNRVWQSFSGGGSVAEGEEGIKPDVVAPGYNIESADADGGYITRSGTSMATPHIAGVAALLIDQNRSLTNSEIKQLLGERAVDLGAPGKDTEYGWGFVDVNLLSSDTIINDTNVTDDEINETENETDINYNVSTNYLIEENVGSHIFITARNSSIQLPESESDVIGIYSSGRIPFFIRAVSFNDTYNLAKFVTEFFTIDEDTTFENYEHNYIRHEQYIVWYDHKTAYLLETINDTDASILMDTYSETLGNIVGLNYNDTIENLRQLDQAYFQSLSKQGYTELELKKVDNFTPQWGGDSPANADELTWGDENWESYYTEGAENWYHTSTLRRGTLEFGIKDIDSGDDLDIDVYDWEAKEWLCGSWKSGSVDDSCQIDKPVDYEWGFYILISPYTIDGTYAAGTLYTYAPDCSTGWLSTKECRSGNEVYREYQYSDCTTEMEYYKDCDDQDTTTAWTYYCSGGDVYRERVHYDYYCSGAGICSYVQTVETVLYDDCGTYEKCSNNQCVAKTCSELGYPKTCSWTEYNLRYSECNPLGLDGDPTKCKKYGDTYCYSFIDTCTSNEYCDENGIGFDATCEAYQCSINSSSWNAETAVEGDSVTMTAYGDHCSGKMAGFEIWESDCPGLDLQSINDTNQTFEEQELMMQQLNSSGNYTIQNWKDVCPGSHKIVTIYDTDFSSGKFQASWTAVYEDDVIGLPDYYFNVIIDNSEASSSSNFLRVSAKCHDKDGDNYYAESGCGTTVDCDDDDDQKYPGKTEVCDSKDNNCDGSVDEGSNACETVCECKKGEILSITPTDFAAGSDSTITVRFQNLGDTGSIGIEPSSVPTGWSIKDGEFGDGNDNIKKDMITNQISDFVFQITAPDSDNQGVAQFNAFWNGLFSNPSLDTDSVTLTSTVGCIDIDGDGYGLNNAASCTYTGNDCDDNNANINPGADESCNGIDDDCDSSTDEDWNDCCGGTFVDTQTDNYNCGGCGIVCTGDDQCYDGSCVSGQICGDDICVPGEDCPKDCIEILGFINPLPGSTEGEDVTINVRMKNKGTLRMATAVEAAIVPDYWEGTIYGAQVIVSPQSKCCAANEYYNASNVSLAAGEEVTIPFTVTTPTDVSIDHCSSHPGYESAWDISFNMIAGTYTACNTEYDSFDMRDYGVDPCDNPDGSSDYCNCNNLPCNNNSVCNAVTGACDPVSCSIPDGSIGCTCPAVTCLEGYNCSQNGACVIPPVCDLPDGTEFCQCFEQSDCTDINESTRCSRSQTYGRCVPINYVDQCDVINETKCIDNSLYRCEQQEFYKDWMFVLGCSGSEFCSASDSMCIAKGGYDMVVEHAPSTVLVNKLPETILKINVRVDTLPIDPTLTLNYDSSMLELIESASPSCYSNSYGLGDNYCYFDVVGFPGDTTVISFGKDAQRINIVGNDPNIVYLTNAKQLFRRYSDFNAVNLMLSKVYEEASRNDGVVLELDTQFEYLDDYDVDHPFDKEFKKYSENRDYPKMTDNNYSIAVSEFMQDKASYAKHIAIIGDDYVIPHKRETYMIRAGSLPPWLRPWYNTFKADAKYLYYLISPLAYADMYTPWSLTDFMDPGKALPDDLVIKNIYTDQNLVQRYVDQSFADMREIFSHEKGIGATQPKIVLPENPSPELMASIENMKQQLVAVNLVESVNDFSYLNGADISCNDFNEFGDWWWFDPIDVPIVIGTPETNPALSCYPVYSEGDFTDIISIEPSVWNGKGSAIIMDTNNTEVIDNFANNIIQNQSYKNLHGKTYMFVFDAVEVVSIAMIPLSFGGTAAVGAAANVPKILWVVEGGLNLAQAADICYFRTYEGPHGAEWFGCVASAIPVGASAGTITKHLIANAKVAKLLQIAAKLDETDSGFVNIANRFTQSADEAKFALSKIPEEEYPRFLQALKRGMIVAGDTSADVGSDLGSQLTKVLMKSNLKRGAIQKNHEIIDLLGDVVAKHSKKVKALEEAGDTASAKEAAAIIDEIARAAGRNADEALPALNIIKASDEAWDAARLKKINEFDKETLKQYDELIKKYGLCPGFGTSTYSSMDIDCSKTAARIVNELKNMARLDVISDIEKLKQHLPATKVDSFITHTEEAIRISEGMSIARKQEVLDPDAISTYLSKFGVTEKGQEHSLKSLRRLGLLSKEFEKKDWIHYSFNGKGLLRGESIDPNDPYIRHYLDIMTEGLAPFKYNPNNANLASHIVKIQSYKELGDALVSTTHVFDVALDFANDVPNGGGAEGFIYLINPRGGAGIDAVETLKPFTTPGTIENQARQIANIEKEITFSDFIPKEDIIGAIKVSSDGSIEGFTKNIGVYIGDIEADIQELFPELAGVLP